MDDRELERQEARQQAEIDAAVAVHRGAAAEAVATGFCLFCGEVVEEGRRWCDAMCTRFWERDKFLKQQRRG